MHFHLPKPLHGWREFAGEVGIIVVGVLIALGAEQAVEQVRWHNRAGETRQALRAEVGHGFLVTEEREAVVECIDEQLNRIEAGVIAGTPVFKPLPVYADVISFTFRAPLRSWADSAWQGAIAEGTRGHLSSRERDLLPIYYAQMERVRELGAQEEAAVGDLLSLSKPLPLDAQGRTSFIRELEAERLRNRTIANTEAQMMRTVGRLGYVPAARDRIEWLQKSGTIKFCRAQRLPLGHPEPAE